MRRLIPLLACALALAACAPQGSEAPGTPPAPPATATAAATAQPTAAPTVAPTTAPTTAATAPPTAAPTLAPTTAPAAGAGEQILFLRDGGLAALDVASGQVAALAGEVSSFAATPDGRLLALSRGAGAAGEIWILRRDTGETWQLTANDRAESTLSWAPDGLSLAYTSAPAAQPLPPEWRGWSEWCAAAEARIVDVPATPAAVTPAAERVLGAGCEPAFGSDGRRIVYTTAPAGGAGLDFPGAANALVMLNRQGENGWRVAIADGATPGQGLLVYAAAWSPDAARVAYQRFVGYQALVDINLTEASSSFERKGVPLGLGAGWMLPPRYAPDGQLLAVTEHNYSDARGFGGYEVWTTTILRPGQQTQVAMPSGEVTMEAAEADSLRRATGAAWSPDGAALVVGLPAGWQPGLSDQEELFPQQGPGELWRWRVGAAPEARLVEGVDFASPLLWLPAAPTVVVNEAEVALAVPVGWGVREPAAADTWVADGPGGALVAARLVAGGPPGGPEAMFPALVTVTGLDDPEPLPGGVMLRGLQGTGPDGAPLLGALRVSADGQTVAIYLTAPERWPLERPLARALLAAGAR
jgi:Tol biopolymer transport system component